MSLESDFLFSFAVPVYNGEDTIAETLQSLVDECDGFSEIVVVDNCSTDNTKTIVKSFVEKYKVIRYVKNEKNLGYDRNFNNCMRFSKGKYVWLVGDDDVIRPGALQRVRDVICKNDDLGFIYVNYAHVNRLTDKVTKERGLQIYNDYIFESGIDALKVLQEYPNFISSMVFLRKSWLDSNCEKYFDTLYIQVSVYLEVIKKYKSYAVSHPYVENKCRLNNMAHKPDFYKNYLSNFISLIAVIVESNLLKSDSYKKREILDSIYSRHAYKYVKVHKIMGGKMTPFLLGRMFKLYGGYPKYWGVILFSMVPGQVISNLFFFKQQLRRWNLIK